MIIGQWFAVTIPTLALRLQDLTHSNKNSLKLFRKLSTFHMKKILFVILLYTSVNLMQADAQINWHYHFGGGVTYLDNILDDFPWPHYTGGAHFQTGTSIGSLFTKDGMVGWEVGINISTSAYYYVPDKSGNGSSNDVEWDYGNRTGYRDWYLQLPVSLTFNMFEGTGFVLGTRINRRVSNIEKYSDSFIQKWIPAAHLGIFTQVTPRIRLDATAFIDIGKRLGIVENPFGDGNKFREFGGSINIRYTIK